MEANQNQLIIEGEVGELYISGVQVMDGYCGDEESDRCGERCDINEDLKK